VFVFKLKGFEEAEEDKCCCIKDLNLNARRALGVDTGSLLCEHPRGGKTFPALSPKLGDKTAVFKLL